MGFKPGYLASLSAALTTRAQTQLKQFNYLNATHVNFKQANADSHDI